MSIKLDLNNKDKSELKKMLTELVSEFTKLKFELKSGKQTVHKTYRQARKNIARLKTAIANFSEKV